MDINERPQDLKSWGLICGGDVRSRTLLKILIFQVFDSSADSFPDSAVCPNGA
jgi:hypothetical protein